ncbi:SDR family NAD(P)-dependent oxidoreductase [Salinisphaera sp. T31B1]|uniref:SDR family NAD(P)-dependent oxidoreductase n=1 Tax=Salinisphaera sp. T31B1 TaxID=727963 RepID=UPI0033421191
MSEASEQRVAIVTGAGGGIGKAIALEMAADGAAVVVNDLGTSVSGDGTDQSAAQAVVDEIKAAGGNAVANTDSVAEYAGASNIIATAMDTYGRVDAVINNAGILRDRMFHKMDPDEWKAVIDVHLHGTFNVSRAAAPIFRQQEYGAYVHMTSTSGLIGNRGQSNYSAAKLGIAALSKSIALDMAAFNVRSNCISPFAWSRMIGSIPTDTPEQQARVDKLKSMTPDKIAVMATYLASDRAEGVSGQIFAVRGNEIFLMSQSRPLRGIHRGEGWNPDSIAAEAIPALKSQFYDLEVSGEVFSWDPV